MKKIVIAIDGPAASGKSTTARLVAERLGYLHIDTGAMYRAITWKVLEEKIPLDAVDRIQKLAEKTHIRLERSPRGNTVYLDDKDVSDAIRLPNVTKSVSHISSYQVVRDVMVREQRRMAKEGGVVLEGRDIGTVVLPNAELKIYMVADVAERARRRKKELEHAGVGVDEHALIEEIQERDRRDSTRTVSPLKKAHDAMELDTSKLTVDEQVEFIVRRAEELVKGTKTK
ncbi:MAG: (d)CMP kinase [Ignavibacteriae bacterium]|nr:(d)CMP kinase [Ignavibacteriota bacterium]